MIRKAKITDKAQVEKIFQEAIERFANDKTFQWGLNYPNGDNFIKDLQTGEVIVYEENDEILGVASVIFEIDENYNVIEGAWLNDEPYASIHRIAVRTKALKRGIGEKLFAECENIVREKNIKNIKIDTFYLNKGMTRIIEKFQFKKCGIIRLLRSNVHIKERIAYQKVLDDCL